MQVRELVNFLFLFPPRWTLCKMKEILWWPELLNELTVHMRTHAVSLLLHWPVTSCCSWVKKTVVVVVVSEQYDAWVYAHVIMDHRLLTRWNYYFVFEILNDGGLWLEGAVNGHMFEPINSHIYWADTQVHTRGIKVHCTVLHGQGINHCTWRRTMEDSSVCRQLLTTAATIIINNMWLLYGSPYGQQGLNTNTDLYHTTVFSHSFT